MVALNFDRARPPALLNLNEVAELRGWTRENGALRLGAGLTYTEAMAPELAELLPALAEASRTVGSPQIRNRGTIGGNLGTASPAGDALPPLARRGTPRSSVRRVRGDAPRAARASSSPASKRNALAPDELITAVLRDAVGGAADVHEGRAAQRDGDRGRLARAQRRRASCARRSARRRRGPVLVHRAARRGGLVPRARRRGGGADRRRARHRGLPAPRAARDDEARARADACA